MGRLSEDAWVRLPLKLLKQHGITKSAATVCTVIVDRATSAANLFDWVSVSAADLVGDTGYTRRTVQRSIDDLVRIGIIERESNKSSGCTNRYRLRSDCIELCGKAAHPKQRGTRKAQLRAAEELRKAREIEEMEAYMSLSNRFLDSGGDDHD